MAERILHMIGFGSQGSAWAQCLKASEWKVRIYLDRQGKSFDRACALGFEPLSLSELPQSISSNSATHWVAMLCPDSLIASIYEEWISHSSAEIRLILAHGYSVYSDELQLKSPRHQATLLAPKAIGPKLLQGFRDSFPHPHRLVAAFTRPSSESDSEYLIQIARSLGFDRKALVPASFEEEAIGDLISEQGLLCGGVMNLLEWTLEAMAKAGVPPALIREECLTELELIAGLLREKGPAKTFQSISQAAQSGTIAMANRLESSGFKKEFLAQIASVQDRKFVNYFQSGDWRQSANDFTARLSRWEKYLEKADFKTDSQENPLL